MIQESQQNGKQQIEREHEYKMHIISFLFKHDRIIYEHPFYKVSIKLSTQ